MRLIDADELRKLFKEEYKQTKQMIVDGQKHLDTLAEGYAEADHLLRFRALTVDAVPVVRCQKCIFYDPANCSNWCSHPKGLCNPGESDFCSYGKRKETVHENHT